MSSEFNLRVKQRKLILSATSNYVEGALVNVNGKHDSSCRLRRDSSDKRKLGKALLKTTILITVVVSLPIYLQKYPVGIGKKLDTPELIPFFHWNATRSKIFFLSASFDNGSKTFSNLEELDYHADIIRQSQLFEEENIHFYTELPDWILNDTRWARHLAFLRNGSDDSSRGAGYWFWKSALLVYHLEKVRDGDFVVYSDTDLEHYLAWFEPLIETMIRRKANLIVEQIPFLERQWSKADVYAYFSCQQAHLSRPSTQDNWTRPLSTSQRNTHLEVGSDLSEQYEPSFLVVRRYAETMQFVKQWRDASQNYALISNVQSVLPNALDFKEHRHDQSLFSLLLKCKYAERGKQPFLHKPSEEWGDIRRTFSFQLGQDASSYLLPLTEINELIV